MQKTFFSSIALVALSTIFIPAVARAEKPMTATDLATFKRLGAASASPDGSLVAYQLRETDLDANKGRTDIWLMRPGDRQSAPLKVASKPDKNESAPAFSPDGLSIYYLTDESGSNQIWRYDWKTQMVAQISKFSTDVNGFKLSPDGKRIAIWGDIAKDCRTFGCDRDGNSALPGPGSGREYDQLFVRHWDAWETPGNYSRVFTFSIGADGMLSGGKQAGAGLTGDSPSKPMGGGEEIAWSADSKSVIFALRKADAKEPLSTNLDLYQSGSGNPSNLTASNRATDTFPAASPDGKWLAYAAMARPGYESDRQVVMLRELKSGKVWSLTQNWDRSVASISWAPDSKSLYVTAGEILDNPIFRIDLAGKVTRLTNEGHVSEVHVLKNGSLVYAMDSLKTPADLYMRDARGDVRKLTDVNKDALAAINDVTVQRFDFKGANGDQVWGMITKPKGAKGKLPVAFVVHGGPQGSFGDGWSFRWNPRVMASQGYAVVSVDFHGSTGYGQAFTDSINKDWGGKPLEDLKLGLAAAGKYDKQVDTGNACALGASYGGYMMNWIAGQWPDAFKCLIQHDGVFDSRAMAYETEELWFNEWEHGGVPYHEAPAEYEKWNPVNHVDKWKTPMLVITSEKDFRIPYTQGLAAFTALQRRDIESKLLIFPDENHWVLKPKNSIQWHRNVFDWLAKYLKK